MTARKCRAINSCRSPRPWRGRAAHDSDSHKGGQAGQRSDVNAENAAVQAEAIRGPQADNGRVQ